MKLIRCGRPGQEVPAILDVDGTRRSVAAFTSDFTPGFFATQGIDALGTWYAAHRDSCPVIADDERLGSPVAQPPMLLCVGLNYADHAREFGAKIPSEPVLFGKAPTTLCGPNDAIYLPPGSTHLDYEVELGLVIGRTARHLHASEAAAAIAGYVLVNDVSERHWQKDRGGQWIKGKSYDHFAPCGPWLASADELGDLGRLDLHLSVNGSIRQAGSTADMLFSPTTIVAYVSQFMTLTPGMIISTGTPAGVALGMKPTPIFLAPGDRLELSITGLGRQVSEVVPSPFVRN
jgi:2-keto-4-pentenoate hydratase/2-oxohepta-3-ene-1,7-dioic acid hydratase in catechol pathway